MSKIKKVTIEDILEQKKIKKSYDMYYDSEVLGGRVDFEKINANKVIDIMSDVNDGNMEVFDACMYIIYLSVPMFRNKKLVEDKENADSPYKIINDIFNGNIIEISEFAQKIFELYGVNDETVKNLKK